MENNILKYRIVDKDIFTKQVKKASSYFVFSEVTKFELYISISISVVSFLIQFLIESKSRNSSFIHFFKNGLTKEGNYWILCSLAGFCIAQLIILYVNKRKRVKNVLSSLNTDNKYLLEHYGKYINEFDELVETFIRVPPPSKMIKSAAVTPPEHFSDIASTTKYFKGVIEKQYPPFNKDSLYIDDLYDYDVFIAISSMEPVLWFTYGFMYYLVCNGLANLRNWLQADELCSKSGLEFANDNTRGKLLEEKGLFKVERRNLLQKLSNDPTSLEEHCVIRFFILKRAWIEMYIKTIQAVISIHELFRIHIIVLIQEDIEEGVKAFYNELDDKYELFLNKFEVDRMKLEQNVNMPDFILMKKMCDQGIDERVYYISNGETCHWQNTITTKDTDNNVEIEACYLFIKKLAQIKLSDTSNPETHYDLKNIVEKHAVPVLKKGAICKAPKTA
jgi:hypothetical protein